MKNKLQPTRTSFSRNFQCKKAPRWLSEWFHFGTENRADQLKKPPCIKDGNMNKRFALLTWSSSETIFENRFVCSPLNCRGLDVFAKRTSIMNYNISQGASMGKYLEEMIITVHFPSQPVQYCALFLWVFVLWGLLYRAPLYTTAGLFTIIMIIIHLIDII